MTMTNYLLSTLLAVLMSVSSSPFNGIWQIDVPSAVQDAELETFAVTGGSFSRGPMDARITIKSDGRRDKIPSDGYVDEVAVSVIGRRAVKETDRLGGKIVYTVLYNVSSDGRTLIQKVTDLSKPDHKPVPTLIRHRRVGAVPVAGSLVSGKWQPIGLVTTNSHLTEVITLTEGRFSSRGPGGYGYSAKIGGDPVPIKGDAADARAAVRMTNERSVVVTMSRHDVATVVMTMTVDATGRTIQVTARRSDETGDKTWLMHKK